MTRLRRPPKEALVPAPNSHFHQECADAGDCKGRGWCFGQTCGPLTDRKAAGRCIICRRRIHNRDSEARYRKEQEERK